MNQLPKDVLVFMALNMDLPEIISLCQTNSTFNKRVCENNYFWLNKLDKDYGVKSGNAKTVYYQIKNTLINNPRKIFIDGIYTENLKLIKAAVESGFVPDDESYDYYLIAKSIEFKTDETLKYLLHNIINKNNIIILIDRIIRSMEYVINKKLGCLIAKRLYGVLFPYTSKIVDNNRYKNFWKTTVIKLKENMVEECNDQDFYNKWIDFYKKLAN